MFEIFLNESLKKKKRTSCMSGDNVGTGFSHTV